MESFDPRISLWFRLHAPEVLRGQLAFGRGYGESPVRPWLRLGLSLLLCNAVSRPDFVAWDIHSDSAALRLFRRLWHGRTALWTARSEAEAASRQDGCDALIFEGFRPKH